MAGGAHRPRGAWSRLYHPPHACQVATHQLRFLERNAKQQWGITVCVYDMSHVPALAAPVFFHSVRWHFDL